MEVSNSMIPGKAVTWFEHHIIIDVGRFRLRVPRASAHETPNGSYAIDADTEFEVLPVPPPEPRSATMYVPSGLFERVKRVRSAA